MSRWLARLRVAIRSLLLKARTDAELTEELRFHLEREIHERVTAGANPVEARRAALRAMGAIERHREECRDLSRGSIGLTVDDAVHDVRFAWRLFRKQPLPAALAIAGLGLAIGVGSSVFNLINASLLRPYGMDAPDTIVSIARPGEPAWVGWPYASVLAMRQASALSSVEAARSMRMRFSAASASEENPIRRDVAFVTGGYLEMLGGRPALGRAIQPGDDAPGAVPVVIFSHAFWKTVLNADPSIVGKTVWLDDTPVPVVGVLASHFSAPAEQPPSMWLALSAFDDLGLGPAFTPATGASVQVTARLAPGASRAAARDNLAAILGPMRTRGPGDEVVSVLGAASPISSALEGDELAGIGIAFVLVGIVLTLACVNTANLLIAASVTRRHEIGVRLAMGATRRRLAAQMLRESLLLGAVAGCAGLLLTFWLGPILAAAVDLPSELDYSPDWRVLLFTLGAVIICGFAAGLAPARRGSRGDVVGVMRSQSAGRITRSRLRSSLVGFQAAASMFLLVVAALLSRSAWNTASIPVGFDAEHVIGVSLQMPQRDFDERAYLQRALTVLDGISSVGGASIAQPPPFGFSRAPVWLNNRGISYQVNNVRADADFLRTMGIHVTRGRAFTGDEVATDAPVALVSERVARDFFPGGNAIGGSLASIPGQHEWTVPTPIVGIVADTFAAPFDGERSGEVYRPLLWKAPRPPLGLVVRAARPTVAARDVERALRPIDSRVQVTTWQVGERMASYLGAKQRIALLMTPAAGLAMVLAILGVYGVMAFGVSQRMPEVSVRLAIGATSRDIVWLMVKDGLRPVLVGLVVGLGSAVATARLFARELSAISPYDPIAFGVAVGLLAGSALVAVLIPAWRSARTDPTALLRHT